MLTNHTVEKLRQLKLSGMAEAFERQLTQRQAHEEMTFEERLALLVDTEATWRENKRLAQLLKNARLKQAAAVEDINFKHKRGLDKRMMAQLSSCEWIRNKQNLCITGPTGTGKTWLACAFGNAACRRGLSTLYVRATRLFEELTIAHGDGSFPRRMAQLSKVDLLILDDFGLAALGRNERHDLLELIEERHGSRSTLITSQLPVENWHEYLADPTIADAVMDRIVHSAHQVALKGESMRKGNGRFDWVGTHSGQNHLPAQPAADL
jgi:DNA replication protein DnaC